LVGWAFCWLDFDGRVLLVVPNLNPLTTLYVGDKVGTGQAAVAKSFDLDVRRCCDAAKAVWGTYNGQATYSTMCQFEFVSRRQITNLLIDSRMTSMGVNRSLRLISKEESQSWVRVLEDLLRRGFCFLARQQSYCCFSALKTSLDERGCCPRDLQVGCN